MNYLTDLHTGLPEPAVYAPFTSGRYSVQPGLSRLGTDFGNGARDACLFQIDRDWPAFHQSKQQSIAERRDKYVWTHNFDPRTRGAVVRLMATRLASEWPQYFAVEHGSPSEGNFSLTCGLSRERLDFYAAGDLVGGESDDAFDALCRQVQEDIAIVRRDPDTSEDWLTALHVCHPSRWSPEEKIGRSFATVHAPVPGMERTRAAAPAVVRAMVEGPPCVRFVWMVEPTDRLNRHPDPPPWADAMEWNRRAGTDAPQFYVRIERQTFIGLPAVNAALFAIRLYHLPARAVLADERWRRGLYDALAGMNAEERAYKLGGSSSIATLSA